MTFLLPLNAYRLLLQVYSPLSHQKIDCKPLGLSTPDPLGLGVSIAHSALRLVKSKQIKRSLHRQGVGLTCPPAEKCSQNISQ